MRYCFDIDGTICSTNCEYKDAVPYLEVIEWINKKYDEGWFKFTLDQLDDWGVKYHSVKLGKPDYDLFIDDKGINNEEWYKIEGLSK